MRQIGDRTFTVMTGRPGLAGEVVEEIPRAKGEDHHRYLLTGTEAPPSTMGTTTFCADAAAARAEAAACKALQGATVSITDATGEVYDNCAILFVAPTPRACIHEGTAKWRVDTAWRIRKGAG